MGGYSFLREQDCIGELRKLARPYGFDATLFALYDIFGLEKGLEAALGDSLQGFSEKWPFVLASVPSKDSYRARSLNVIGACRVKIPLTDYLYSEPGDVLRFFEGFDKTSGDVEERVRYSVGECLKADPYATLVLHRLGNSFNLAMAEDYIPVPEYLWLRDQFQSDLSDVPAEHREDIEALIRRENSWLPGEDSFFERRRPYQRLYAYASEKDRATYFVVRGGVVNALSRGRAVEHLHELEEREGAVVLVHRAGSRLNLGLYDELIKEDPGDGVARRRHERVDTEDEAELSYTLDDGSGCVPEQNGVKAVTILESTVVYSHDRSLAIYSPQLLDIETIVGLTILRAGGKEPIHITGYIVSVRTDSEVQLLEADGVLKEPVKATLSGVFGKGAKKYRCVLGIISDHRFF